MTIHDIYAPIPIVLLNWNGITDTLECIAALDKQTFQDFIIWLVDNGSEANEVSQLKNLYGTHPKVTLVLNEKNLGFTAGNNRILEELLELAVGSGSLPESDVGGGGSAVGSQQSTVRNPQSTVHSHAAPYVVLLNNDTVPSSQWLEQLLHTALSENADMVSSKMVNYFNQDIMDNAGHVLLNTLEVLPLGHDDSVDQFSVRSPQSAVFSPQSSVSNPQSSVLENAGACGGAALYSTAMLRDIGIFDKRFTNGYEDVELGLRAVLCGYRSVYAAGAVVLHKGSQSINKIRDFGYTLWIQRHIYYIIYKLFPWPVLLLCMPFMIFRFFAALLINLFALRWKFLRIQIVAVYHLIFTDFRTILVARRKFFKEHQVISTLRIMRKMKFFWKYDWARFRKYILRREKMVFERY